MDFAIINATHGVTTAAAAGRSCFTTPIANRPLLCHVLDELAGSGIGQARIVAGAVVRKEVEQALARNGSSGISVSYADAPASEPWRTVLVEIERALSREPVLLHPGDCLFRGGLPAMRDRYHAGDVDCVLPAVSSRAPSLDHVSHTALMLGSRTQPLLDELLASAGDGEDLAEVLLHSDVRLAVCELSEQWRYSESTEVLLAANRMILDSLPFTPIDPAFGDGNRFHGRIALGQGTFLSGCVVQGPAAIAERVVLEDSFIGPYTAIGTNAVLSGAEIDNSMVLAGAEIRHPGQRLEASIIGERARVTRSFDLPRGLHMRLGPDSQVSLS